MSARSRTWTLEPGREGYPAPLMDLREAERPRLFGAGDRQLVGGIGSTDAVTIVGSRNASGYGLRVAERLGRDLAQAGVTVVSGLARGIDAAAHRGALDAGGRAIAVLAGGPDVIYPRRNAGLYERVLATGAVVAERPPGTAPRAAFFVCRNRIMAAFSAVTVIVEAAQPSGSLVTADRALDLGRTVAAVPGQLGVRVAEGTNDLLKDGAPLIRDARDILDLLYGVGAPGPAGDGPPRVPGPRPGPPLDPEQARVLDLVSAGAGSVDRIALDSGLAPQVAAGTLARLELLGYVVADALGAWRATDQRTPE